MARNAMVQRTNEFDSERWDSPQTLSSTLPSNLKADVVCSKAWIVLAGNIFAFKLWHLTAYSAQVKQTQWYFNKVSCKSPQLNIHHCSASVRAAKLNSQRKTGAQMKFSRTYQVTHIAATSQFYKPPLHTSNICKWDG